MRGIAQLLMVCLPMLGLLLATADAAHAHEVRPALLTLTETGTDQWRLVWKQPVMGDRMLPLEPVLGPDCPEAEVQQLAHLDAALVTRATLTCAVTEVTIAGLERTLTDVLVTVERLDGSASTSLLRPEQASLQLASGQGVALSGYFVLGVEHLLGGWDHLLFVFGLMLLVQALGMDLRQLVWTITSFTLAHSITLACAALDLFSLPARPVEACIALSLVLLTVELVRVHQGKADAANASADSYRMRPWMLAFAFGLLHGFGFAGALKDIGLPPDAAASALLLFNLGIEAGQLLVVAGLVVLGMCLQHARQRLAPALELPAAGWLLPVLVLGTLATWWTLDRTAAFF